jgi:hypothetical protein
MTSESPLKLPALQQAALDPATLDQLFADLAACTQVLAIIPRHAARTMVIEQAISLTEAQAALRSGALRGVQIRYRYDHREWNDTLLPTSDGGARLVRICTDDVLASTSH